MDKDLDELIDAASSELENGGMTRQGFFRAAGKVGVAATGSAAIAGRLAPAASAASSAKTVSFLNWHTSTPNSGLGLAYNDLAKRFKKKTGTTVKFEVAPFDSFLTAVTTRIRANKLSDAAELLPFSQHQAAWPGFTPLHLRQILSYGPLKAPAGSQISGDNYFGVPCGGQGILWYYNKSLFGKAGLNPNRPPATWDEFTKAANALTKAGIPAIGISGADSFTTWFMLVSFMCQHLYTPADFIAVKKNTIKVNDPRFLAAFNMVAQTAQNGWWDPNYKGKKFDEVEADFANGRVAMVPGIISDILNWKLWDTKLGRGSYQPFVPPLMPGAVSRKKIMSFTAALSFGINKKAKNPELAREWIKFLVSAEGQAILLKDAGQFPNRTDVDILKVTKSPGAKTISDLLASSVITSGVGGALKGAVIGTVFQKLTTSAAQNEMKTLLDELQTQQAAP